MDKILAGLDFSTQEVRYVLINSYNTLFIYKKSRSFDQDLADYITINGN